MDHDGARDGRPHVTPLVAVWLDDALHFATGSSEQKAVNLRTNPHVVVTTGCATWDQGIDVMVEGEAVRVTDPATLQRLADAWGDKWDGRWQFGVADGAFRARTASATTTARVRGCSRCGPPRSSRSGRSPSATPASELRRVPLMAILGEYYHVGIVVPDVEAAMAHLTELLGITWGPVVETEALEVRDGDGNDLVVPNKLCYSTAPPHLELVQEVPGSVWECNEHSNLHHIGVWTDALPADSQRYSELRCPLQLCGRDADGVAAARSRTTVIRWACASSWSTSRCGPRWRSSCSRRH